MAKKLILVFFCIFWLCPVIAMADDYVVYQGEEFVEFESEDVAPADSVDLWSADAGATTTSSYVYFEPFEPMPAATYPVLDDGMISNTYLDWARGMLVYLIPGQDYVFARTGQYQYIFAIGDFKDGFKGFANVYQLNLARSGSTYSYVHVVDSNFNLTVSNRLVYASVAPYPSLTGTDFSFAIFYLSAFVICLIFVFWLVRHAFMPFGRL